MSRITAGPFHESRYTALEPVPGREELLARVKELLVDLAPDTADLLPAFHRIQHEFGYVPPETVAVIAEKFRTTPAMIFGVLDFYSEVRTAPPAEKTVEWCSGPACLLKGSMNIRRTLEAIMGCPMNGNTEDRTLGLQLVQCDGTCHLAPLVRYEGRYIGPLTVSSTVELAREIAGRQTGPAEAVPGGKVEAVPMEEEEQMVQRMRTQEPEEKGGGDGEGAP